MNQNGWEKSLGDGRERKGRLRCSQEAWRGPLQQAGQRESGGRHGRRAVLLKVPALPETTNSATQPRGPAHLSLHTPSSTRAGQPAPAGASQKG